LARGHHRALRGADHADWQDLLVTLAERKVERSANHDGIRTIDDWQPDSNELASADHDLSNVVLRTGVLGRVDRIGR
jgi:hypothetical protein